MDLPTLYFCRYPILFIIINLCLFCRCSNELDDCFFLTDDKVQRKYDLDAFDTVKSTLKGILFLSKERNIKLRLGGILVILTPSAKEYTSNNSP